MIKIKENAKPQCWYEETETGYQVCIRKPHNDYFRTEYIKCQSKEEAKELITKIKENGYTNISRDEEKACTNDCTKSENSNFSFGDDDFTNKEDKAIDIEPKEEKPKAKFEFGDEDDIEHKYNKIPRYDDIPQEQVQETGVNKPLKFGNVQIGKGIL